MRWALVLNALAHEPSWMTAINPSESRRDVAYGIPDNIYKLKTPRAFKFVLIEPGGGGSVRRLGGITQCVGDASGGKESKDRRPKLPDL
mmetsp:Transcript_579/g.1580  ORF Transcript_579/g.1580 Transcript_579/m.1580 type:complete len:89 (-) Transcript_579:828-1094(-)